MGSFLGYFARGLLGFGEAIIVIVNWTIFSSLGINAGPLQLVICADAISNVVVSIPFLFLAESGVYGDYFLFTPILIIRNSAAAVGALLFRNLSGQLLELITAPALFLSVFVKYGILLGEEYSKRKNSCLNKSEYQLLLPANDENCDDDKDDDYGKMDDYKNYEKINDHDDYKNYEKIDDYGDDDKIDDCECQSQIVCIDVEKKNQKNFECDGFPVAEQKQRGISCFTSLFPNKKLSNGQNLKGKINSEKIQNKNNLCNNSNITNFNQPQNSQLQSSSHNKDNILIIELFLTIYNYVVFHAQVACYLLTCRFKFEKSQNTREKFLYSKFEIKNNKVYIFYKSRWFRHLPALSLGGFFAGIQGSMVGIPGPPLMYAFSFLNISKEICRANISVIALFDMRAIFYYFYGSLLLQYWHVYLVGVVCASCGLILGSPLSKFLKSNIYHHILMVLVLAVAILLMLRGLGVVENA